MKRIDVLYKIIRKKQLLIGISVLAIIGLLLMSSGNTYSIIETGTGDIPIVSIKHTSTTPLESFDTVTYGVSFAIKSYDSDNNTMLCWLQIHILSNVTKEEVFPSSFEGDYWITVWSIEEMYPNPPPTELNPLNKVVAVEFYTAIDFQARLFVCDLGYNAVADTISSTILEDKTANSFTLLSITTLSIIVVKRRKAETEVKQ